MIVVVIVFLTVPLTLWALDREGPYKRLFGIIDYGRNMECGPDALYYDSIKPGGCVAVVWTLEINSNKIKVCKPTDSMHVSRTITDANGVIHTLPKVERYFGPGKQPFKEEIRRPFIYPKEINVPGLAVYHSAACFFCNPLQEAINWPVCVDTPDAEHEVLP